MSENKAALPSSGKTGHGTRRIQDDSLLSRSGLDCLAGLNPDLSWPGSGNVNVWTQTHKKIQVWSEFNI